MRRFLIGALAVVGALSLLFLLASAGLFALAFAGSGKPQVPGSVVLELEVDGPFEEVSQEASLAAALGEHPTTVRDVVDALEKAGSDSRVKGLVVRIGNAPGSMAVVQELRDAVKAFRATGKKAVAYADSFGEGGAATGAYYFASAFDEVYIQPSGDVALVGLGMETAFARDGLAKLGVQPRLGKRYEYKNAVNTFTEQGFTAPHREATERFVGSLYGQVVKGIAEERELTEDAVRAAVDRAPLLGKAAMEAKLVDGLRYRDEVYEKVKQELGGELLFLHRYLERAGRPHTTGDTVALVYGVGAVVRGESQANPLTGETTLGGETVAKALRRAADDEQVKAIIFRVDSPGGSYVASDTVRREVQRARERGKAVIVSMGTYAASGGYFVSMDADRIVAQPGTLTGSIGVYGGKMVTAGFWEKLGINFESVGAGKNALMYSTDADFTPEQLARNEAFLDRVYEDFTGKAAAGRKLPLEKLRELARGRVWTGEDALEHGLVDALGGFPVALKLAKEEAKIPADAPVRVEVFPRERTPAEELLALLGQEHGDSSDDEEAAETKAHAALAPVLEQTRALYQLGVRMGLVRSPGQQVLLAPVPETRW